MSFSAIMALHRAKDSPFEHLEPLWKLYRRLSGEGGEYRANLPQESAQAPIHQACHLMQLHLEGVSRGLTSPSFRCFLAIELMLDMDMDDNGRVTDWVVVVAVISKVCKLITRITELLIKFAERYAAERWGKWGLTFQSEVWEVVDASAKRLNA